jgi:light-regulated signal transduction histidine kinase (bacteriophytochrome)
VIGSALQLEQVVINLVNNALQALPSNRQGIKVSTKNVPATGDIEVAVADEGTGMPPEVLARWRSRSFHADGQRRARAGAVDLPFHRQRSRRLHLRAESGRTGVICLPCEAGAEPPSEGER